VAVQVEEGQVVRVVTAPALASNLMVLMMQEDVKYPGFPEVFAFPDASFP
jgi:hypothetical protein